MSRRARHWLEGPANTVVVITGARSAAKDFGARSALWSIGLLTVLSVSFGANIRIADIRLNRSKMFKKLVS